MEKKILNALLTKVMQLHENGHYAELQFSNYGFDVTVSAIKGGFRTEGGYDFNSSFMLTESDKALSTMIKLDEIIEEWGVKENE